MLFRSNLLLEVIEKNPDECGYEFGRWTSARLATYLELKTGIKLSSSQVRRILDRKKFIIKWERKVKNKGNAVYSV